MSTSLLNRIVAPTLPDWAQLGGRLFVTDGVNPNLVMVGNQRDMRPMGSQAAAVVVADLAFGAGLTGNAAYTYGIRRVVVQGALEVPSGMRTALVTTRFLHFLCGTTAADAAADWDEVANGEFAIVIGGVTHDVTGIDFSATHGYGAVTAMADVAARMQVALRAVTSGSEIVQWLEDDARFLVRSPGGAIASVGSVSGGSGTDLSLTAWMNGADGAAVQEHAFVGGTPTAKTVSGWVAVTDGAFGIEINAVDYQVSGLDFSEAASMDDVAAVIQTGIRAETSGGERVDWDAENLLIVIRSWAGPVGAPSAPLAGTDLSVKTYLNAAGGSSVSGECQTDVVVPAYEWDLPSWAEVRHEIWRSKAENPSVLYRLAVLTAGERDELADDIYADSAADSELEEGAVGTFDVTTDGIETTFPPCRYVRAWDGALVMGGSYAYSEGSVSGADGASQATLAAPAECTPADTGAFLAIDGEPQTFRIMGVDVAAKTYTLDKPLTMDHAAAGYKRFRDFDVVYIGNLLPGNIELYDATDGVVYGNRGDNDPITGIAINGGWCFVLRRHRVDLLNGSPAAASLIGHPASPPGCASHATIADRYCPALIYYAGQAGVVIANGSDAQVISQPIRGILETRVDHSMDAYAHAVYDPRFRMYWLWLFEVGWEARVGIRVPDLALVYSLDTQDWCVCRLAASGSGLWRRKDGELVPVVGVAGGVGYLESGYADGGEGAGVVTEADAASLTDENAEMDGEGAGLAGAPVFVYHADGTVQERLVRRNTPTRLWPTVEFDPVPAVGDRFRVGSIPWSVAFEDVGLGAMASGDIPFEQAMTVDRAAVLHDLGAAGAELKATIRRRFWASDREAGSMERDADASDEHVTVWAGKNAGLRAHVFRLEFSGDRAPMGIRAVSANVTESSK